MDQIFYDASSIDYPIVDADAHVNEPPELWQERVPGKWRERAPRLEHTSKGDVGSDGSDGSLAALEWSAPVTNVAETEPNGSFDPDRAFFPGSAQVLVAVPLRLQGFVSYRDDEGDANAITIPYPQPPTDRLEDLFALYVNEPKTVSIELEASNPARDLDLFVLDISSAPIFPILAQSNGPPGTLERIDRFLPAGLYLIGVSWCCDITTLPPPPGTSYELRLFPELLPEPSSTALGAVALATLAVLANRRAAWGRQRDSR